MPSVLFIVPPAHQRIGRQQLKFHRTFPPLSCLLSASLLRTHGWNVDLIDMNARPDISEDEVRSKAAMADVLVYTTNPYADWQCPSFDIEHQLRFAATLPPLKTLITGNHASHFPGDLLKQTNALACVRDEPEFTLLAACTALHQQQTLAEVEGLSWRDGDTIKHNPARAPRPLQELPFPAYDLINLADYHYELLGGHFALLETSRGCPYRCNFCNLSMFQQSYRRDHSDKIIAQVRTLVEQHGCRSLYFFDLEFTLNRKVVQEVCQALIDLDYVTRFGFRWCCQTRADSVTPELLSLMKQAGCSLIHFGVEAGNPQILAATNKKIDQAGIRRGLAAAKAAHISTAAFFIMGHPNETPAHFEETLQFALELNPTFASFHPFLSFPGSPLYTERHGPGPYWDLPLDLTPTFLTPEQATLVEQAVRRAYFKFYLRLGYIAGLLWRGDWTLYRRQFKLFWKFWRASSH